MMKIATLASVTILLSGGSVLAEPMTSGRPSAVLNDAQCQSVWSLTERDGDTLSADKARPFIVNFQIVDANGDGKISWDEFKTGCGKGLGVEPDPAQQALASPRIARPSSRDGSNDPGGASRARRSMEAGSCQGGKDA